MPDDGYSGVDGIFTYRAADDSSQSSDASVVLTVNGGTPGGGLAFEEIQSGVATSLASVTTTTALAAVPGQLYIAAITS